MMVLDFESRNLPWWLCVLNQLLGLQMLQLTKYLTEGTLLDAFRALKDVIPERGPHPFSQSFFRSWGHFLEIFWM